MDFYDSLQFLHIGNDYEKDYKLPPSTVNTMFLDRDGTSRESFPADSPTPMIISRGTKIPTLEKVAEAVEQRLEYLEGVEPGKPT